MYITNVPVVPLPIILVYNIICFGHGVTGVRGYCIPHDNIIPTTNPRETCEFLESLLNVLDKISCENVYLRGPFYFPSFRGLF